MTEAALRRLAADLSAVIGAETDVFEGPVNFNDELKVSANGKLTAGVQAGEEAIARVIAVST